MKVFSLFMFLIILSFLEIKKLLSKKKKKEIYAFSILTLIGAYLSFGQILGLYVPNPTNGLKLLFEPIQTWFLKFFS